MILYHISSITQLPFTKRKAQTKFQSIRFEKNFEREIDKQQFLHRTLRKTMK